MGEGGEPPGHLPPPVVLLDDDDGPLLLPAHLELRDVALVLPALPVSADHDLRLPQLVPALARLPAPVNFLDDDDELVHPVPPPLLQLVQDVQSPDKDLCSSKGVFSGTDGKLAKEISYSLKMLTVM